jgi:hypothetical protein
MVAKVSTPTPRPLRNHVHKRVILDAALELNRDNPITSFTKLCVLINNAKMVDKHFAICLVKEEGSEMWRLAGDIPNNMTAVCLHVNILGNNLRMFEKQCHEGGKKIRGRTPPTSSISIFQSPVTLSRQCLLFVLALNGLGREDLD